MSITLDYSYLKGFVEEKDFTSLLPLVEKAHNDLEKKKGPGREFTGWIDLPSRIEDSFLSELEQFGKEVRGHSDCLVSIGVGGSYLGIKAVLDYVRNKVKLPVYFAGHNINSDYTHDLLEELKDKKPTVVVISKSGTTTEPALAFRLLKDFMKKKYSANELKKRIVCVTDAKKGALRAIADENGFQSFEIPDDVGGRFSVLTSVGLVPLAMTGVDIRLLVAGARQGQKEYGAADIKKNISYQYAASRYLLFKKGKAIEVLSSFYDNMASVAAWWQQLFGESEGKGGKGIYPSSQILSTDLHSMGQLMQEGARNIFETFLMIDKPEHQVTIPKEEKDIDGFNCVAGKDLDFVNKQAYKATAAAHFEGGVPNMTLTLGKADLHHLGQLFYFYEKAVAMSGYLLGVNPFDQPGVEAYKKKMFALLGK